MLQFSVDNYGFLVDHALPQYFTIIMIMIIMIMIMIMIIFFSLRSKQNFFYDSVDGVR